MNMNVPAAVLEVRQHPVSRVNAKGMEFDFSPQLRVSFDKETRAVWSRWTADPRPCFNSSLLADIRSYYDFLASSGGHIDCFGEEHPIEYVILASGMPGVFNLGGDLDLFRQLIDARDGQGLLRYGRACIDVLYRNYISHDLPVTTVSLVQGECLGGGFEAALSSDVIVAERGARFGFPEILFNLFPGMGAYSFLERKIGQKAAEEVLTSGKIYSAEEMHALGVVDVLAEDGEGEDAIAALIKRRQRSRNGLAALATVRRRVHRIDFSELLDIVQIWVDAALRLNPRDLKLMQRLVSRQNDLGESQHVHKKSEADSVKTSVDDQSKNMAAGNVEAAIGDSPTVDPGSKVTLRTENGVDASAVADASAAQSKTDTSINVGFALNVANMENISTIGAVSTVTVEGLNSEAVIRDISGNTTHGFAAKAAPGASGGNTGAAGSFALNRPEAKTEASVPTVTVDATTGDVVLCTENIAEATFEASTNTENAASTRVGVSVGPHKADNNDTLAVPEGTLTGSANVKPDAEGSHVRNTTAEGDGATKDETGVDGAPAPGFAFEDNKRRRRRRAILMPGSAISIEAAVDGSLKSEAIASAAGTGLNAPRRAVRTSTKLLSAVRSPLVRREFRPAWRILGMAQQDNSAADA